VKLLSNNFKFVVNACFVAVNFNELIPSKLSVITSLVVSNYRIACLEFFLNQRVQMVVLVPRQMLTIHTLHVIDMAQSARNVKGNF